MQNEKFLNLYKQVKPAVRRAASVIRRDFKNLPRFPTRGEVDSFALDGLMYVAEQRGLDGAVPEILALAVNKAKWLIRDHIRSEIRESEFKENPTTAELIYSEAEDPADIVANEQGFEHHLTRIANEVGERNLHIYLEDISGVPQADIAEAYGIGERHVREVLARVRLFLNPPKSGLVL